MLVQSRKMWLRTATQDKSHNNAQRGARVGCVAPAAMPEPNYAGDGERDKRRAQKCMGNAAVMSKLVYRPAQAPKHIQVGRFGCQGHGERRIGSPAVETGAAQACASEEMRDRFHEWDFL